MTSYKDFCQTFEQVSQNETARVIKIIKEQIKENDENIELLLKNKEMLTQMLDDLENK